jgi:hypothetical protein
MSRALTYFRFDSALLGQSEMRRLLANSVFTALTILTIGAITAPSAESAICIPPPVELESGYQYISSLVTALAYTKEAFARQDRAISGMSDPSAAVKQLLEFKLVKAELECAALHVAPYGGSSNAAIRVSADSASTAFNVFAALTTRVADEYTALLDGKFSPIGTSANRVAEIGLAYDQTWETLLMSAIAGTYSIVEENAETGKMSKLALTPVQRDEILKNLREIFGADVTKGLRAGENKFANTGGALYQVISNPIFELRQPAASDLQQSQWSWQGCREVS